MSSGPADSEYYSLKPWAPKRVHRHSSVITVSAKGTLPRQKTEGRLLLKKAALPLRAGKPLVPSSLAHSRFTPCFSSFCLALPGRLKAPSCGLGKPELRAAAASCWK